MPRTSQELVRAPYKNQKLEAVLLCTYGRKPLREWACALSEKHGVKLTHGTLHRALHGIAPRRPELAQALGFPKLAPAPVCLMCGVVHVAKRCPSIRKAATKPRRQWKREALIYAGLVLWQMRQGER